MLKIKSSITAIAATAAFLSPLSAKAVVVYDPTLETTVNITSAAIVRAIEMLQGAVVDALRGNSQAVATAQTKAAQQIADAHSNTLHQERIDKVPQTYAHPDECAAVASTESFAAAVHNPGGGSSGGGKGGTLGRGAGISSLTKEAIDSSTGLSQPKSPEVQAAKAAKGACIDFADGWRRSDCADSGLGGGSIATGLPNADIRAESIINGPQASMNVTRNRLTFKAGTKEASAIDMFMRNLNTPIELRQLTKAELSSQAGRQFMSYRDSYESRMSMAEKPIRALNARRLNDVNNIGALKSLLQSPAASSFVSAYLSDNYKEWERDGISTDELVNIEVLRRHANINWQTAVASMPPDAVAREQLINSAFQNYLMWRLIQSTELNGVVSGMHAGTATRTEMTPQLNALHSAAAGR